MSGATMDLRGKRLCALDVGTRRIGVAVCDEFHIVVSTRPIIDYNEGAVPSIRERCAADRIDVLLVGVPRFHDERTSPIIEFIERFVTELRSALSIPVVEVDEAFSTQEARAIMISTGRSRKHRNTKGVKDQVAAAVILRSVIEEQQMNWGGK